VAIDHLGGEGADGARKHEAAARLTRLGGVELVAADLLDVDLPARLEGAGAVVHLAGRPGVQTSWGEGFGAHLEGNVLTTQAVCEAALAVGVGRVVLASSSSIYGDVAGGRAAEDRPPAPTRPYGVAKVAAEQVASVYAGRGLSTVALRYFTVYGPGQRPDMACHRLVEAGLGGPAFRQRGDGRQRRELTHVDDVVRATIAAVHADVAPGTVCNVGGGSVASLVEVRSVIEELLGRAVPVVPGPAAPGDPRRTAADLRRAARLLTWEPEVELHDGLADQLAWHRARADARRAAA
jgi:nucleoside-diphosphate-sugar epimerase